jgi:chemotaxis protein MotB
LTLACFSGCVSKGKYRRLEDDNNKTKSDLAAAATRVSELEDKLGIASNQRTKLETSVQDMQKALEEQRKRQAEAEKRIAEFRELTAKFKAMVDAGKLSVKVENGRMVVALSTDILFPSGSAKLSKGGRESVIEVADLLKTLPDRKFQIEGHTDNVPIKTAAFPSNWELASARAITVLRQMVSAGLSPTSISAASYADTEPAQPNDTPEGRTANRRIAIVVVPDLSGLPGFDELQKISSDASATTHPESGKK